MIDQFTDVFGRVVLDAHNRIRIPVGLAPSRSGSGRTVDYADLSALSYSTAVEFCHAVIKNEQ
jgi:hypothetical protein